jgi:integrase
MMVFSLNIVLRGRVYHWRKAVPVALRAVVGQREWVVSLHTSDPAVARQRAHAVALRVERILADAKRTASPENAARAWKTAALREDLQDRIRRPRTDDELDTETLVILDELEKATDSAAKQPTPMNLARRDAFQEVLRRLDGTWTPEQPEEDEGVSLTELFLRWETETRPPAKTKWEWDKIRQRFTALALGGADLPVKRIERKHLVAFKDALLAQDKSPATVSKALAAVKSVLSFGVNNGLLQTNAAVGVKVARKSNGTNGDDRVLPYTVEEARSILEAASKLTDHERLLPWIAAYSGMRLQEAGGLRIEDVRQVDGVWCFSIEDTEVRRIKTASSRRLVPVSPVLIEEAGLLAYRDQQKAKAETRLFPDMTADRHGIIGAAYSKWYGRWARKVVADRRKVFHSWRHLVEDRLRDAGIPEDQRDGILGHSSSRMGRRYGQGFSVAVLLEAVKRIRY